jgi:hypothetical protein
MIVTAAACGDDDDSCEQQKVHPVDSDPLGTAHEEWAAQWWQWVAATEFEDPATYGCNCDTSQTGDVFFLGPQWGGFEVRDCTLSSSQSILITVINQIWISCPPWGDLEYECPLAFEDGLLETAAAYPSPDWTIDQQVKIDECTIGNAAIQHYFVCTQPFEIHPPDEGYSVFSDPEMDYDCADPWEDGNECDAPVGPKLAIGCGWWMMVKPLPAGEHTIHILGSVNGPDDQFGAEITYNLTVVD